VTQSSGATWVTGAHGFIGRHVVSELARQGDAVAGIGHGAWAEADWRAAGLTTWLNADVGAESLTALAQVTGAPRAVIHLAGGSSVALSLRAPHEDFQRTVCTSLALLDWLRSFAPRAPAVFVSSAAVYGEGHAGRIAEQAAVAPLSPYGAHKAMMELACRAFAGNYGLRIVVVRLFSVYGAGLEKQLLWDLCGQLAAGAGVTLSGTGREQRDWLHVTDAARLLTAARGWAGVEDGSLLVLNGGTGIGVEIRDLAGRFAVAWGNTAPIGFSGAGRAGDPVSLVADVGQLNARGFRPLVHLDDGLAGVVSWYRARTRAT